MVLIMPAVVTLRITKLALSAIYILPIASMETPIGCHNLAAVAGPPSPLKPGAPGPAKVLIMPAVVTLRIRLLPASAIEKLPAASKATPEGAYIPAAVADARYPS